MLLLVIPWILLPAAIRKHFQLFRRGSNKQLCHLFSPKLSAGCNEMCILQGLKAELQMSGLAYSKYQLYSWILFLSPIVAIGLTAQSAVFVTQLNVCHFNTAVRGSSDEHSWMVPNLCEKRVCDFILPVKRQASSSTLNFCPESDNLPNIKHASCQTGWQSVESPWTENPGEMLHAGYFWSCCTIWWRGF